MTFQKSNSISLVTYEQNTQKFRFYNSNSHCLYPNRFVLLWILSYQESAVVVSISSLAIYNILILFLLECNKYQFYFEIYSQLLLPTENNQWNVTAAEQKATVFLSPE